jgi:Skp family chaperone for outer membrane proteins
MIRSNFGTRPLLAALGGTAAAAALALVLGGIAVVRADDTKKPAAPTKPTASLAGKIVFVDVEDAINGCKRTKELKEKLQKEYADKKKQCQDEMKQINDDADELQLLSQQSAEFKTKQRQLRIRALTNDIDSKANDANTDDSLGALYKEVYDKIRAELAKMGQEEGWAAVLVVNRKELQASGEKAVTAAIGGRTVMWFDPTLDVTDRLLERLNK